MPKLKLDRILCAGLSYKFKNKAANVTYSVSPDSKIQKCVLLGKKGII